MFVDIEPLYIAVEIMEEVLASYGIAGAVAAAVWGQDVLVSISKPINTKHASNDRNYEAEAGAMLATCKRIRGYSRAQASRLPCEVRIAGGVLFHHPGVDLYAACSCANEGLNEQIALDGLAALRNHFRV